MKASCCALITPSCKLTTLDVASECLASLYPHSTFSFCFFFFFLMSLVVFCKKSRRFDCWFFTLAFCEDISFLADNWVVDMGVKAICGALITPSCKLTAWTYQVSGMSLFCFTFFCFSCFFSLPILCSAFVCGEELIFKSLFPFSCSGCLWEWEWTYSAISFHFSL